MKLGVLLSLVITFCLLLFPPAALANDGAAWGVGGSVQMMSQHGSVRMVKERVDVTLYPDRAVVRCRFEFKNEGRPVSVKMGFPESGYGDAAPSKGGKFRNFRSWVDGREVKTNYVQAARKSSSGYTGWHTKIVHFGARQRRVVRDDYESPLGGVSDGQSNFSYVLRTGRSWKGPIGQGVVVVDASRVSLYGRTASPNTYLQKKNRLIWKFRNTDPSENIFVGFYNAPFVINGEPALPVWGSTVHSKPFIVRRGVRLVTARLFEGDYSPEPTRGKDGSYRITRGSKTLVCRPGSRSATLNGAKTVQLPHAPILVDRELLVPFYSVVHVFGGSTKYEKRWNQTLIALPPVKRH